MKEAIFGILGTVVGTILGWALNTISSSVGKIDVVCGDVKRTFRNIHTNRDVSFYENPDEVRVNLQMRVTNFKKKTIGLNCCKLQMQYQDITVDFLDLYDREEIGDNLEELANIPANYTKLIHFVHDVPMLPESEKLKNGYKIIMRYHVNGKKKEYKNILFEEKSHNEY